MFEGARIVMPLGSFPAPSGQDTVKAKQDRYSSVDQVGASVSLGARSSLFADVGDCARSVSRSN